MAKTWRERHPFLWGMTQVFGIAPVRRPVETVEESFARVADAISDAERQARKEFYGSCTACEQEHCHCWDDAYDACLRCRGDKAT